MKRPSAVICDGCDTLTRSWIDLAGRVICDTCDDHTRWCSCGLMLAGSARQIIAMAEVHWRREPCPWALHPTQPEEATCNPRSPSPATTAAA